MRYEKIDSVGILLEKRVHRLLELNAHNAPAIVLENEVELIRRAVEELMAVLPKQEEV